MASEQDTMGKELQKLLRFLEADVPGLEYEDDPLSVYGVVWSLPFSPKPRISLDTKYALRLLCDAASEQLSLNDLWVCPGWHVYDGITGPVGNPHNSRTAALIAGLELIAKRKLEARDGTEDRD